MKIRLTGKNVAKIHGELRAVNGRSSSFCYTAYSHIEMLAHRAEAKLARLGVLKKNVPGTVLTARQEGPAARSYKYAANATVIKLTRTSGGWFLTDVIMGGVYPCEEELFDLSVEEAALADILKTVMIGITSDRFYNGQILRNTFDEEEDYEGLE